MLDRAISKPVFMASSEGGMEIEEVAANNPDAILKEVMEPGRGLRPYQARRIAYALGIEPSGDNADPRHVEAVATVLEACQRHGVTPGIHTHSAEYSRRYLEQGYRMVMLGADGRFLRTAAAEVASLRDLVPAPGASG